MTSPSTESPRSACSTRTSTHNDETHTNNLAALEYRRGDYAQAEVLWRQALEIKRELLGPDHPEIATTIVNLGVLAATRGQDHDARALFEQALTVLGPDITPDHPALRAATENLAMVILGSTA